VARLLFVNKRDAENLVEYNQKIVFGNESKPLQLRGTRPPQKPLDKKSDVPDIIVPDNKEKHAFTELFSYREKRPYTVDELELRADHRYYTDPKRLMVAGMHGKTNKKYLQKEWEHYKALGDRFVVNTTFPMSYLSIPDHYQITITSSMDIVKEWIDKYITDHSHIGIDTENDLVRFDNIDEFQETSQSHFLPDLISFATEDACLLIQTGFYMSDGIEQPPQQDVPENLIHLLSLPSIKKIFFGTEGDLKKITRWLNAKFSHQEIVSQFVEKVEPDDSMGYVDMQSEDGMPWKGVKMACSRLLGVHIEKSAEATFSRWSRRTLHESQIKYAVEDAYATLLLYNRWKQVKETILNTTDIAEQDTSK
jgi:hypothetical protein